MRPGLGCVLAMGARAKPLYPSVLGIAQLLSPRFGLSTPGQTPSLANQLPHLHLEDPISDTWAASRP